MKKGSSTSNRSSLDGHSSSSVTLRDCQSAQYPDPASAIPTSAAATRTATLYDLSQVKREIVAQGISESEIQFVFISVDPARDKAAQIQRYVQYFDPAFLGATGSIGQLTNLTRQLGAPFRAEPETATNVYEVTHSSAVYLVDPLGRYAGIISPPFVASEVAAQFSKLYRTNEAPQLALRR